MFNVRPAQLNELEKIYKLYKKVAAAAVGIARSEEEITEAYIKNFMLNAAESGIEFVIENPDNAGELVAEIHCYKPGPKTFRHVLGELTIVVHPEYQGSGLGKMIFTQLLEYIKANRPDIMRVELIAQESNEKAIAFYRKLGFSVEGKFEKRIYLGNNRFEADVPMAWFNPAYNS